jgi:predicted ATPase
MSIPITDTGGADTDEANQIVFGAWLETRTGLPNSDLIPVAVALLDWLDGQHRRNGEATGPIGFSPWQVTWQPGTNQVSTAGPAENEGLLSAKTLPYSSPEQSGKTDFQPDYRSDYFALGVVLYELATGYQPFAGIDPANTVFKILTAEPPLAQELNPALSRPLSLIINKLLAKNPDERYQSADGLRHDLITLDSWADRPGDFIPGLADRRAGFLANPVVVGIEADLHRITTLVQHTNGTGQKGFVWIEGAAGTGKTTLLEQLDDRLFADYFVLRANLLNDATQPLAALRQSLEGIVEVVMTLPVDIQQDMYIHLLSQVDSLLPVLIEFCPAISRLTGNVADKLVPLPGSAGQERLAYALSGFLKALMLAGRPVVWLFDGFQAASDTSLRLLDALARETSLSQLTFVVAVGPEKTTSPGVDGLAVTESARRLLTALGYDLNQADPTVPTDWLAVSLGGMSPEKLADWLRRLAVFPDSIAETANLIYQKTGGNPYYTDQLLRQAAQAGFMAAEPGTRWFRPDLGGIASLETTENRLNMLISRVFKLSPTAQVLLGVAACWGQPVEPDTLRMMSGLADNDYRAGLDTLMEAGLLTPQPQSARFGFTNAGLPARVLAVLPGTVKEDGYRAVADYLNRHANLESGSEGLFRLADAVLNLPLAHGQKFGSLVRRAAQDATGIGAFGLAMRLFEYLIGPVRPTDWQYRFEDTFGLYLDYFGATAYSDDPDNRFDALFGLLSEKARHRSDTIRIAYIRAQGLVYRQRFDQAIRLAIQVVAQFGVHIRYDVSLPEIIAGLIRVNALMYRKTPAQIENLPENPDDEARQVIYLLYAVSDAVFLSRPVLLLPFMYRLIQSTFRYGLTPESGMSFMQYALIETSFNHQYRRASVWANLTHRLHERFGAERSAGFLDAVFVRHWTAPLTEAIEQLHEAYRRSREVGQLTFAFYALGSACVYELYAGTSLDAVLRQSVETLRQAELRNQTLISTYCRFVAQTATDLMQPDTPDGLADSSEYMDWQANRNRLVIDQDANSLAILLAMRLMTDVHRCTWHEPLILFRQFMQAVQQIGEGSYSVVIGYYYGGLACLLADTRPGREALALARLAIRKLAIFSRDYPNNNQSKYLLIRALYALKTNQTADGIRWLDETLDSATRYGQPLDKALAHELKAAHYETTGQHELARRDWQDALAGYAAWGAEAVVSRLQGTHPFLKKMVANGSLAGETGVALPVELPSLLKMSNSIASTIRLENLLENLMNVLLENAGAQRAALLLVQQENLWVYADTETSITPANTTTLLTAKALAEANLPQNLIRYAARTARPLALAQAHTDRAFGSDPYIRRNRTLSALAMPVVKTGETLAVLYLENNAIPGAFGQQQLTMLHLLSSQIVTSLENALLYNDLENRVQARTDELRQQKERSDRLLLSILPETVADELKQHGRATACLPIL